MDIATLLGLAISFVLVGEAIALGGDFSVFVNLAALLIVVGGTVGATITNFPPREIFRILRESVHTIALRLPKTETVLDQFMDFAYRARREGILSLEPLILKIDDPYLKKGLQLTVDGLEPEAIRSIMTTEIDNNYNRHAAGVELFNSMASYAPALGLIGTVIGLVHMLRTMNDPSSIGPAMAVALITTFSGAVLANLVFLPVCGKLKHRAMQQHHIMEMQMAGVLCLARGENPRILREILEGFQPPRERGQHEWTAQGRL
jgi:chemotaxis protein MotA